MGSEPTQPFNETMWNQAFEKGAKTVAGKMPSKSPWGKVPLPSDLTLPLLLRGYVTSHRMQMGGLTYTSHERLEILEDEIDSIRSDLSQLREEERARAEETPVVYNAAVYSLGNSKYELTIPLQVVLEEDDTETVARVPELNIYASADTDTEAIFELKRELITYYEHLRASKRKLGPLPQSHLETLKRLITEKNG